MPKKIDYSYVRTKTGVKQRLHSALPEIQLACDVWTTEHKNKALPGIVVHFVDAEGNHRKALLGLPRLRGGHGGQLQVEHVNGIID